MEQSAARIATTDSADAAEITACHECDQLHRVLPIAAGSTARCTRCGADLYRRVARSIDRSLALYLAALMLFILANSAPFLSMKVGGIVQESRLVSAGWALYQLGMPELGAVVFLTSVLIPLLVIFGMVWMLAFAHWGIRPPKVGFVYRWVHRLTPWSLIGVFMLGTLISVVKLRGLAAVIPGVSLFAFVALLVVYSAARSQFEPSALWRLSRHRQPTEKDLLPGEQMVSCHTCQLLRPRSTHEHGKCPRCGSAMHWRKENSLTRTWALLASAIVMLLPANYYPVMTVVQLGKGQPDTILSGVMRLIEAGLWGLALIVFFASIVVPVMKLIALVVLLVSVRRRSGWRPRDRTFLYRVTEWVGAWSMVDVFLVGLLSALVSLSLLAEITPGIGATFFGAVVVLTMLAAHSFDPRLIWDHLPAQGDLPAGGAPDLPPSNPARDPESEQPHLSTAHG